MNNTLIVCGGTGAHIALALLRLHVLGNGLGFFRHDGEARTESSGDARPPLRFPSLYLVDQDSGPGGTRDTETAWQRVRLLLEQHPARHDWHSATGLHHVPQPLIVTPLPVGQGRDWYRSPNDSMRARFNGSPLLGLLASPGQRQIEFSKGMMGSPALGSLLFRLKAFDRNATGVNFDKTFEDLLGLDGRVAVAGSGVGGTGASVGPTLARQLATSCDVMAVMLLNWFRFDVQGVSVDIAERAQDRNRVMLENAHSALQYYALGLSRTVATVPIGIPDGALLGRSYTADAQQPLRESYAHAVAAVCCLRHFLAPAPYGAGLYQMGSNDSMRFGGGNDIPGGTVQALANQARTLADMLNTFVRVLRTDHRGSRLRPAIHDAVSALADPRQVADALETEVSNYRAHLQWMESTLGVEARPSSDLCRESLSRQRLVRDRRPLSSRGKDDHVPETVALALFHWTAEWIRDIARPDNGLVFERGPVQGAYWPKMVDSQINVAVERAGHLTKVPDANVGAVIKGFVDRAYVSENGWPDPVAAVDYFRDAIEQRHPAAIRQLQMLTIGLVNKTLELRDISLRDGQAPQVSLESLVREYRAPVRDDGTQGCPGFASVAVVHPRRGRDVVLGFNSPHTLLCPVPFEPGDTLLERAWEDLWVELTGSSDRDWTATNPPPSWTHAEHAIRVVKGWIAALLRSHGADHAPAWVSVLEGMPSPPALAFGTGPALPYWWEKRVGDLPLPTIDPGDYQPAPGAPVWDHDALFSAIPELRQFTDDAGQQFERVTFSVPGRDTPMHGIWTEHLQGLQTRGTIYAFGADHDTARLFIATLSPDLKIRSTTLAGTWLLDRQTVMVESVSPMRQEPVPGSTGRAGDLLYPDLPVRTAYAGLVMHDQRPLLDLLKDGTQPVPQFAPEFHVHGSDPRPVAQWNLHLLGRSKPVSVRLAVPAEAPHQAHWMVWPNFRHAPRPTSGSTSGQGPGSWRAYYIYENCSFSRLHVDALWLNPDSDRVELTRFVPDARADGAFTAHPIAFRAGAAGDRYHQGGPPLALALRDVETQSEKGLYLIRLRALSRTPQDLNVGVDFGTSHTVLAYQDGARRRPVEFASELDGRHRLVLHVSESAAHLDASFDDGGLLATGAWLPNYARAAGPDAAGLLPSELVTIQPLDTLATRAVTSWLPGRDYAIPPMQTRRRNLARFLLADFKWETSFAPLRKHEPILREIYLSMVIELAMAEIVSTLGGVPAHPVRFTFTYPLRISAKEFDSFKQTLNHVLANCSRSLGCLLALLDEGTFDESRAAQGGTENFGDVCIVGDLGGGTLDLFISAQGGAGLKFRDVADSARLGGNLLLQKIAADPARYLPRDAGWNTTNSEDCQTQLRAWMRSKGAAALFGPDASDSPSFDGLALRGFPQAAQGEEARSLIHRYFRILTEYMARSLVAYLSQHWYGIVKPEQHHRLHIILRLRGNGWRLWPESSRYAEIEREIEARIQQRVEALWPTLGPNTPPVSAQKPWGRGDDQVSPKAAPILKAVGKAMSYQKVQELWHSYALVELEVLQPDQSTRTINWFERMPFETGGEGSRVELGKIAPPIPLTVPRAAIPQALMDLDPHLKLRVNEAFQDQKVFRNEVFFDAPVAPLVWEAAFDSTAFHGR